MNRVIFHEREESILARRLFFRREFRTSLLLVGTKGKTIKKKNFVRNVERNTMKKIKEGELECI